MHSWLFQSMSPKGQHPSPGMSNSSRSKIRCAGNPTKRGPPNIVALLATIRGPSFLRAAWSSTLDSDFWWCPKIRRLENGDCHLNLLRTAPTKRAPQDSNRQQCMKTLFVYSLLGFPLRSWITRVAPNLTVLVLAQEGKACVHAASCEAGCPCSFFRACRGCERCVTVRVSGLRPPTELPK